MKLPQMKDLLLQSLEHERGGVLVYRTALECVRDERLSSEWKRYLEQTENHVSVLTSVCVRSGWTRVKGRRVAKSCTTPALHWLSR